MEAHDGASSSNKTHRFRPAYWRKEQVIESRVKYFLSETPLHAIDDEDIEKALNLLRDELLRDV